MGLSGLVGAGAQQGLDQLLARQMAEQQMAMRLKALEAEEQNRRAQVEIQRKQVESLDNDRQFRQAVAVENIAQGQAASQAEATKEQAAQGARTNASLAMQMPGLSDEQKQSEVMGAAMRSGDKTLVDLSKLTQKPEPKMYPVTTAGPNGPLRKLVSEAELAQGVPEYEKPPTPDRPPRTELTPGEKMTQTRNLKNEYTRATGTLRELKRQSQMMQAGLAAAAKGDMAAGSQAVLVTFQKILDPTSVVRESEYARSASGQSLMNQMEGYFERLAKGGAGVPVEELAKFAQVAQTFVDNAVAGEGELRQQYVDIANEFGLNPNLVVGASAAPKPRQRFDAKGNPIP